MILYVCIYIMDIVLKMTKFVGQLVNWYTSIYIYIYL